MLSDDITAESGNDDPTYTPRTEYDGVAGYIQTGPLAAPPTDFTTILEQFGYNPEQVQIVGHPRVSKWEQRSQIRDENGNRTGDYETIWLSSYRFLIEPRGLMIDLPALYAEVRRTKHRPVLNRSGDTTVVVCWADIQTGKALSDETPMLTTDGWKTHGEIRAGDYVYGADGQPKHVLGVTGSTEQELFRIDFDRKISIVATGDHLWNGHRQYWVDSETVNGKRTSGRLAWRELLWTTNQIAALHVQQKPDGTSYTPRSFQIDLPEPLEFPEANLPIDPYLLGVWLGDGSSYSGCITIGRQDEAWISQFGYSTPSLCDESLYGVRVSGLTTKLRAAGLIGNKHIPQAYLTSSTKQRLALLQGLMDTDGYCDTRGVASFSNTNRNIADGVCFLFASLGFKYTRKEGIGRFNGKEYKPFSEIAIPTRADMSLFTLKRKADRQISDYKDSTRRRQVQRVVPVGKGMAQCLQVEGGLYLAGRELIVTHNCDHLGGLKESLERLDAKRANLKAYLQKARFDHIVVADCGDIIEGFQNFDAQTRTNSLSIMDQIDVAATEFWKLLSLCARFAPVDVLSIPSNHCRWGKGKSLIGKTTDDWGLHVSKRLERHNEEIGLPITFHRAEDWMETLEFDVRNSRLGLAHGHQVNNPDQIKTWWAKMTHAGVLSCDVLVTGHFHFPSLRPSGKTVDGRSKWHVQASTLDNGSSWVRNKYGEDGDPALTVFRIDDNGFDVTSFALL